MLIQNHFHSYYNQYIIQIYLWKTDRFIENNIPDDNTSKNPNVSVVNEINAKEIGSKSVSL